MALFGRRKSTIGLDVGSGLIKVAVIDHSRGEPELARVVVTPLLADAIVEGEVMDPGIVTDAIRMALEQCGLKSRDVVTAVGGRDVIIKKIQIERVKEQQARELMRWEAEQHVPFDMESVELDFQILDPEGSGVDMSVLLVAAKRELIESKIRLLSDAGARAAMVDVDAFALHNAFEVNHPDAMSGVVGLINVGHEVTNINILDDGVPILTRDITVGTRRFREDLQRERGLGADEAEARKSPSASSAPPPSWRRRRARPARCGRSSSAGAAPGCRASPRPSAAGCACPWSWPTRSPTSASVKAPSTAW